MLNYQINIKIRWTCKIYNSTINKVIWIKFLYNKMDKFFNNIYTILNLIIHYKINKHKIRIL